MKEQKTHFTTISLVYMALLVALNLVLMRVLRIELGAYRITVGYIATIMAGIWLGPLPGAVCGLTADLLGCLIDGYAVNPLISLSAMVWGIVPAFTLRALSAGNRKARTAGIVVSVSVTSFVCILFLTTAGLVMIGYNLAAILPGRALEALCAAVIYSVLTCVLYFSPVTALIREKTAVP